MAAKKKSTKKKKVSKKKTTKKVARKQSSKKATKKVAKKKSTKKVTKKVSGSRAGKKKSAKKSTAKKKVIAKPISGLKDGDKVPSGRYPSTKGDIELNKLSKAVIYFYPKDNTPGCTLEGQDFSQNYKKFKKKGYEIFGVSPDSIKSHDRFKDKFSFPFELISDEDQKLCKAFGVWIQKSMYGRTYMGVDRSTYILEKGKIKKAWRKVKVKDHVSDVLGEI